MIERVKYICKMCSDYCVLKVGKDACAPFRCPYNETDYPKWELMSEDGTMTNEIPELEIKGMNVVLDRYEMFRKMCLERRLNLSEHEIIILFHAYHTEPVG